MPAAWTRRLEEELLADQVARCWEHAPFYRRKLADARVRPEQVQRLEDLRRLPFTTHDELRASQEEFPPLGDYVCAEPIEIVRVHPGSDAEGGPPAAAYTERDLRTSAEIGARAFWTCGVRPDDTVLHCRPYGLAGDGLWGHEGLEATGAAIVAVGPDEAAGVLRRWPALAPDVLCATREYPGELARAAAAHGLEPGALGLERLILVAEPGAAASESRAELWGVDAREFSGLPEVWVTLGGECDERAGLHFCGQGATLVELVEPDGEEPVAVEAGAEGELVFTHLDREASPLLRFRSRVQGAVLGAECPCGRTGFRFRVLARS